MTFSDRRFRVIAAFVGINLLLVVVGWVAVIAPQRSAAATAAAAAQVAQSQLGALQPGSSQGRPSHQPAINTSCIYKLDTALPSQSDITNLLFELQRVAKVSGVKVTGVSPQAASATASGYTVLPINLNLDGSYFAVTTFLHNLRTLVHSGGACPAAKGPLFGVTAVSFSGTEPNGNVPATAGIDAYYYGVTAGAAAPVSPTATDTTTTTTGG